jgi:hypothetical protein
MTAPTLLRSCSRRQLPSVHRFVERALFNRVYRTLPKGRDHTAIYNQKKWENLLKKVLTSAVELINLNFRDRSGTTCSSACAEISFRLFSAVTSWTYRTAFLCGSAVASGLACERPGACFGRTVFIRDDLAQ